MRDWDPIGVAGEPNAIDDYDRYAEHIVGMLQMKQGIGELAAYLDDVATKMMGLRSSPATSRTVADNLRELA